MWVPVPKFPVTNRELRTQMTRSAESGDYGAVAAATNGNKEVLFAGESDARDDVGSSNTADDDGRSAINHRIGQSACGVVAGIAGTQD
jgi:hypothetical protein